MQRHFTQAVLGAMLFSSLCVSPISSAQTAARSDMPPAGENRPPRREPPPQAYESCKGKKEGDTVQIVTPRDEKIVATCISSPKGLFARPAHPPGQHGEHGQGGPQKK